MTMKRRQLLTGGLGTVVLSFGPAQLAWGSAIVAVRVWPAADYTLVTIESDQALPATHFIAENPQHCYQVAFDSQTLWGDDAEPFVLHLDLFDSYLEPAS